MEARDLLVAADHDAQGVGDVRGVDAEVGGALAVDLDAQLRLVELERGVGVHDAADLLGAVAQVFGVGDELFELRAAQDEVDVEAAARAEVERRRVADADAQRRVLAHAPPDLLHHVLLRVVAAEGLQRLAVQRLAPDALTESVRSSCGAMRT